MLMTPRYMIMAVSYKRAAAGHILPFCRSRLRGLYRHHLSPSSSLPYFPPPCSSLKAFFAQVNDPSQHYHLPLLLNSFSFTTYRGSQKVENHQKYKLLTFFHEEIACQVYCSGHKCAIRLCCPVIFSYADSFTQFTPVSHQDTEFRTSIASRLVSNN